MASAAFTPRVLARSITGEVILDTPDLRARLAEFNLTVRDLETLRDRGREAEALNHAQGQVRADGKAITLDSLVEFEGVSLEYSMLMGACRAISGDLKAAGAPKTDISRLEDIIKNQAQVAISTELDTETGKKTRSSKRKVTQEAARAEMSGDVVALQAFPALHAALAERGFTAEVLATLKTRLDALSGKVGARLAKKGEGKQATADEHAAVAAQTLKWGTIYRLLAAFGRADARVAALLRNAAS